MSDEKINYDRLHALAVALAQKTAPTLRGGQPDRDEIASLVGELEKHAPSPVGEPEVIEKDIVGKEEIDERLSKRIERIYPIIHRTYEMFKGTNGVHKNVDIRFVPMPTPNTFSPGEKLRLSIKAQSNIYQPYIRVVAIRVGTLLSDYYVIERLHPNCMRSKTSGGHPCFVKSQHPASPNYSTRVYSQKFEINRYYHMEEFVRLLVAGGSKPEHRQMTLNHLLSLPEILGPYLDRKERGGLSE